MTRLAWFEEPIRKDRDREAFDCGEESLNDFLRHHARKNHEQGGAKTFLAIDAADKKTIFGFYSVSPASIEYARTPSIVRKGLADWYAGYGALPLLDNPLTLLLPLATIANALQMTQGG